MNAIPERSIEPPDFWADCPGEVCDRCCDCPEYESCVAEYEADMDSAELAPECEQRQCTTCSFDAVCSFWPDRVTQ